MSSLAGYANTAASALSTGIIIAIVVGSVIGLALLIGFIICLYCLCCRKKKTYPGAVIQAPPYGGYPPQGYGGQGYGGQGYGGQGYNNQAVNKV